MCRRHVCSLFGLTDDDGCHERWIFEANPKFYPVIEKVAQELKATGRINVRHYATSAVNVVDGDVTFHTSAAHDDGSSIDPNVPVRPEGTITVKGYDIARVITENYCPSDRVFVKLDAEGYDMTRFHV
jgi:FkbM family methyltransferase